VEDQPVDPGVLTAENPEPKAQPRRRWGFLRRRQASNEPDAAPETEAATEPDAAETTRTPVGKARRKAQAVPVAEAVEAEPEAQAEPVGEDAPNDVESESETTEAETAPDTEVAPTEPVELVAHRPVGKRLIAATVVTAGLFVGAGAFAGAAAQPYLTDRALAQTKLEVARTAANAITTLWTYTPDDMETLPDRASKYLAGDFASEYRRYIDAIVASNKQAQISNNTQVVGAAVESISPSEATAIVYTNSVSTSPVSKNIPSLRYLSYRLTLQRHDADWLITRMTALTKLDLTPQL
jgi:Mce-associated membrane protein